MTPRPKIGHKQEFVKHLLYGRIYVVSILPDAHIDRYEIKYSFNENFRCLSTEADWDEVAHNHKVVPQRGVSASSGYVDSWGQPALCVYRSLEHFIDDSDE